MIEALHPVLAIVLVMWVTLSVPYQERASRAVHAVQTVERGAIGYFERESTCSLPVPDMRGCTLLESSPSPTSFSHDICHGEIVWGPGPEQRDALFSTTSPPGETCNIKVADTVRQGDAEMTLVYRGTSRQVAKEAAGFTVEARVPWFWWTIEARGGGDVDFTTQTVRRRDVTVELDGAPALGDFLSWP